MSLFKTTTIVRTGERLLEYVDGTCTRVLEPGKHRLAPNAEVKRVHVLDRLDVTAPQEVLTADGVAVRVTTAVRWAVTDARRYVEAAVDPFGLVYLAIQVALRDELVDVTAEDAVRRARLALGETLAGAARTAGAEVGIAVRTVVVKDVILPHELRAAYAELVTARARGLAQLEAARAETAALRSLANGAKLLDEHPALARLRLVQALPHGSTVELTTAE
ncbi:slipin family protein [Nocardioides mangrovi]|uniref:Slipin family protein n=1 Tax=Nocardioides mangrovi TaxID=2874580 RepID=A0ABS7U919_9ACTN|nr:slipin family protein [Nocardioides mangrovi]MBZ5737446.1 slipin family protein [Nocardioides mangrovi]